MKSVTASALVMAALFFSGCDKGPEPRQNESREHLTSTLSFPFRDPKWTPPVVKCGETFENNKVRFTYRKATREESPDYQGCSSQSIEKDNYSEFEIIAGSTFVIDVSRYKGISSIGILGYRDYCGFAAGRIYAVDLDGKIIDIVEPEVDYESTNDIIFENNLENLKEVRIVGLCEVVRPSEIRIRGSNE